MELIPLFAAVMTGRALPALDAVGNTFWESARREGMEVSLADVLVSTGWPGPPSACEAARRELAAAVARWTLASRHLEQVLDRLHASRIRPILIKGAALERTHYPRPYLRPRIDTDLLILEHEVALARSVFESLGGTLLPHVTGRFVMPQFHYRCPDDSACVHAYDVHWRIVVPPRFARALSPEEIAEEAVPIPAAGPHARAPSAVHALLLACVHRAAHHGSGGPLIWLYDVHLLCERMSAAEQDRFCALSIEREVAPAVQRTIADAHEALGGHISGLLARRLLGETSPAQSRMRDTLEDLQTLGWRDRLEMIKELLVPGSDYMRSTYAPGSTSPLPLLYLRRIARGARRWTRN